MKLKTFVILLIVAAGLVALALRTSRTPEYAPPAAIGRLLLSDLKVNDVAQLVMINQAATVTVTRLEGKWVVAEKHNYPANFERVRDALIKLADIKIGDEVDGGADACRQLGVVVPSPTEPDATQVRLVSASGQALASVLLGKNRMHKASDADSPYGSGYPTGRYVSPDGGATLYVIKDPLTEFTTQAPNWINSELLNVDATEVTRLTVTGPGREPIELTRPAAGGMVELPPLASDEEADAEKLSALRNALVYFNLQDIADPALTNTALGLDAPAIFTAETGNGRIFRIMLGGKADGDGRYARCQVEYIEPALPAATAAPDTNAAAAAVNAPADTNLATAVAEHAAVRTEVNTLAARLAPWTFVVPNYKADAMLATRSDLVKKKATEPEPAAAAPTAEPADADSSATNGIPEETNE